MSPYQSSHCPPVQTDTVSHVNSSHAHSPIAQVLKHSIVIDKTELEKQVPEQQTREFMENLKVINHKNSKNTINFQDQEA